jgi:hypothetical protein
LSILHIEDYIKILYIVITIKYSVIVLGIAEDISTMFKKIKKVAPHLPPYDT